MYSGVPCGTGEVAAQDQWLPAINPGSKAGLTRFALRVPGVQGLKGSGFPWQPLKTLQEVRHRVEKRLEIPMNTAIHDAFAAWFSRFPDTH